MTLSLNKNYRKKKAIFKVNIGSGRKRAKQKLNSVKHKWDHKQTPTKQNQGPMKWDKNSTGKFWVCQKNTQKIFYKYFNKMKKMQFCQFKVIATQSKKLKN